MTLEAPVLRVQGLTVEYATPQGPVRPVHDLGFSLAAGECVALVGPSGSGKSTAALALLGLVPPPGRVVAGRIQLAGRDLAADDASAWATLRGRVIALVPQEPLAALTPVRAVGAQVAEALRAVRPMPAREAAAQAVAALAAVGLDAPARRARQFPHELSGGQRQRVLLAMALLGAPQVVVADEPTSALDVLWAAEMMQRLTDARHRGLAVVLLSHDPRLVAAHATQVVPVAPRHAGDASPPRAPADAGHVSRPPQGAAPILEVVRLDVRHPGRSGASDARPPVVQDVSFRLAPGGCLAIVGESGAGKTSLVRALLRLGPIATGEIRLAGTDLLTLAPAALRAIRPRVQPVFQDPGTSLHPWRRVGEALDDGLRVRGITDPVARRETVATLLTDVGLDPALADRLPSALSGGQRQRVAMARALATAPDVLVCDEPVSALDLASQAEVLATLDALRRRRGLAVVCVAHDLGLVRAIADDVLVLHRGRIVEAGPVAALFAAPRHPYTAALVAGATGPYVPAAADEAGADRANGDADGDAAEATGCVFFARCRRPAKDARCRRELPPLTPDAAGHAVACHYPLPPPP